MALIIAIPTLVPTVLLHFVALLRRVAECAAGPMIASGQAAVARSASRTLASHAGALSPSVSGT